MNIACFQNLGASGARRALYYFTKGLKERGHTVDYYTFKEHAGGPFSPGLVCDNEYTYDRDLRFYSKEHIKPYILKLGINYFLQKKYYKMLNQYYKEIAKDINERKRCQAPKRDR